MSNMLNWLLNFIQHRQLVVPLSDEAYRQNHNRTTVIVMIIQKIKKLKITILDYINKLYHLDPIVKAMVWMVLAVCIGILLYWLRNKYGRNQPPGPKKPERQASKQGLKKNSSFVSIKQYQSHTNSDSSSVQDPRNISHDKQAKLVKQYCTDIETDPHNAHYESALQSKRDKFFFTLMGSFKNSKKVNQETLNENSQLDYQCEYEQSEHSPKRQPTPQTIDHNISKINVQ